MATQTLIVNGKKREVKASPDTPLLYVLRGEMGLGGAKFGCGLAQCGACTVIVEGKAVRSCVLPVGSVKSVRVNRKLIMISPSRASAPQRSRTRYRKRSSRSRPWPAATAPTAG